MLPVRWTAAETIEEVRAGGRPRGDSENIRSSSKSVCSWDKYGEADADGFKMTLLIMSAKAVEEKKANWFALVALTMIRRASHAASPKSWSGRISDSREMMMDMNSGFGSRSVHSNAACILEAMRSNLSVWERSSPVKCHRVEEKT